MSMLCCKNCGELIDTDEDPDYFGPDFSDFPEACESCRDAEKVDREAERERICVNGKFHDWKAERDWMGDPTIPNGTMSFLVWRCKKCGAEAMEQPVDWQPFEREYEERDPRE